MLKLIKLLLFAVLVISICSSCNSLTPEPTTAPTAMPTNTPAPTNTPIPTDTPTPTPTPIPLSELDLTSLLIQEGDLPAGYSGAQIRDMAPQMFDSLPKAEVEIYQQLSTGDQGAGGVTVLLYETAADIETAYKLIADGMTDDAYESTEVGEVATVSSLYFSALGMTTKAVELVFVRCHAIVHIRMMGTTDIDSGLAYARRLDARLQPLVCR